MFFFPNSVNGSCLVLRVEGYVLEVNIKFIIKFSLIIHGRGLMICLL